MSMSWIRDNCGVPAKRGAEIRFAGARAVIVGSRGQYLRARMVEGCRWADAGQIVTIHPTWEVEYLPSTEDQRDAAPPTRARSDES